MMAANAHFVSTLIVISFLFFSGSNGQYTCYSCINCLYTYNAQTVNNCPNGCQTSRHVSNGVVTFRRGCVTSPQWIGCPPTNPSVCNCFSNFCNYGYSSQAFGDFPPYRVSTSCYYCANCHVTSSNTPIVKCSLGCAVDVYKRSTGDTYNRGCIDRTVNTLSGCDIPRYNPTLRINVQRCNCRGDRCNSGTSRNPYRAYKRCHYCIPKSYVDTNCNGPLAGKFVDCTYGCRKFERSTEKTTTTDGRRTTAKTSTVQKDCAPRLFARDSCTTTKVMTDPKYGTTNETICTCLANYCNVASVKVPSGTLTLTTMCGIFFISYLLY